jgi:small subunit ribosomal protein S6
MKRNYELVVVLSPELTSTQVKQAESSITQLVKDNSGTVVSVESWGKKRLAYKIKKHEEGSYLLFTLEMEAQKAGDFDKAVKMAADVIRHMLLVLPEQKSAKKAEK